MKTSSLKPFMQVRLQSVKNYRLPLVGLPKRVRLGKYKYVVLIHTLDGKVNVEKRLNKNKI